MNKSEQIIKYLEDKGVGHIFMVAGGQIMFLMDALYKSKIKPVCCHHEQAAAMAAEGYSRVSGFGVCLVTAGPGAINAINGVVGAWVDSSPLLIISGASTGANVDYMEKSKIRQHGLQGIHIKPVVSSIVKYFKTVKKNTNVEELMDRCYKLATTARKGPVWIEVPLDISRTL
jgi:acetolactate synthase-1/2/3 large subunit